jgi:hypothetical protein
MLPLLEDAHALGEAVAAGVSLPNGVVRFLRLRRDGPT